MKKILIAMFLLAVFAVSAFAAEPYKITPVGETGRYNVEFTNQEGIFYQFPLNQERGKTVYTEGILINKGDHFLVGTTSPKNTGFTHVLRFDSIDNTNDILSFTDLGWGTGQREVTYDSEGKSYLVVGGITYTVQMTDPDNSNSSLTIDLNGDGRTNYPQRVFIHVEGYKGFLDFGLQDRYTGYSTMDIESYFPEPVQEEPEEQEKECPGECLKSHLQENGKINLVCSDTEYEIELLVLSETSQTVKFRVNGEITSDLGVYTRTKLADGSSIYVSNVREGFVEFTLECPVGRRPIARGVVVQPVAIPPVEKIIKKSIVYNLDFDVVVGDMAPGSDVIAAIDIIQLLKTDTAAKLSSEIGYIGNIISIGNPCDNPVTKRITGISDCHMGLEPGQGFIGFYNLNNKIQVVVAGYSEQDTRRAARAFGDVLGMEGNFFIIMESDQISSVDQPFTKRPPAVRRPPIARNREELTPPNFPDGKTITMNLEKGWNLVSLPGKLIQFLKTDCAKKPVAFVYLKNEKKYVSLNEAARILGNEFSTYLAENAFWIYSYDDCEQKVIVEDFNKEIELFKGWNLLPNMQLSCKSDRQYWWNKFSQEWQTSKFNEAYAGMIVKSSGYCEERV